MLRFLCLLLMPLIPLQSLFAAVQVLKVEEGHWEAQALRPGQIAQFKGDWMIFPNRLLSPRELLEDPAAVKKAALLTQPGVSFGEGTDPVMKSTEGFATYLLELKNLQPGEWAFWGVQAWTSSRVYFFSARGLGADEPAYEQGKFSERLEDTEPMATSRKLRTVRVHEADTYYFLIQVASYRTPWGGMWLPPLLADIDSAIAEITLADRLNYLIIGVCAFVALYSLSLFLRRRSDKASLLLFLFATERTIRNYWWANYGTDWLGNLPASFELTYKLVWFFWLPSAYFMFAFYRFAFPRQMPLWFLNGFAIVVGLPFIYVLFTPVQVHYAVIKPYYTLFMPIMGLAVITIAFRAVRQREEGAAWLFAGACFIVLGGTLDMGITYGITFTTFNNFAGITIALFLICQSQIVSQRFAEAFRKADHLSRELQNEVNRQTRDIKSILANIKQGIFSVHAAKDAIDPQYSDYLTTITGIEKPAEQTLNTLLLDRSFLNQDEKAQVMSCVDASINEDLLAFELNQANLPQTMVYERSSGQKRTLELDWVPMLDQAQKIEKILISLRDVTEVRELQEKSLQQEEDLKILIELINVPEDRFHRFLKKSFDYLAQNRQLVMHSQPGNMDVLKQLFMNMHTIKGTARTYLLRAIANASHEAEDRYALIQKGQMTWEEQTLLTDIHRVEGLLNRYQEVGQEKLGWQLSERLVKMPVKTMENVLHSLNALGSDYLNPRQLSQLNSIRSLLYNYGFVRLQDVIEEASRGLDSIARDLEKPSPRIDIDAPVVVLKEEGVNVLHGILVHLLRNSLDHGIEAPEVRASHGKPTQGTIFIMARPSEANLLLSLYDDGAGLNLGAIKNRAVQKGLLQSDQEIKGQEIAQLIFESGLSTKDSVSEISGRGVGLHAVKTYLDNVGGQIDIQLAEADGRALVKFHFEIKLPAHLCYFMDLGAATQQLVS